MCDHLQAVIKSKRNFVHFLDLKFGLISRGLFCLAFSVGHKPKLPQLVVPHRDAKSEKHKRRASVSTIEPLSLRSPCSPGTSNSRLETSATSKYHGRHPQGLGQDPCCYHSMASISKHLCTNVEEHALEEQLFDCFLKTHSQALFMDKSLLREPTQALARSKNVDMLIKGLPWLLWLDGEVERSLRHSAQTIHVAWRDMYWRYMSWKRCCPDFWICKYKPRDNFCPEDTGPWPRERKL